MDLKDGKTLHDERVRSKFGGAHAKLSDLCGAEELLFHLEAIWLC
jgi:hypothetical protein